MTVPPLSEARKTRRDRQAQTRLHVIAAARQLFLVKGYHRTTLSAGALAVGVGIQKPSDPDSDIQAFVTTATVLVGYPSERHDLPGDESSRTAAGGD